ncbi:universal stress protein UspC [Escherichia fergusonii]|uniref:universal stress protein UspC n=1 Tax=Escherichia fergusonii TaxID=564 RepID=UPI0015E93B5E|nr:universal stress protein UspC [Escherichia fergusonii]QME62908.1 universal stress protein UspC [Escherichia fergusonii]QME67519.1 universal stress protein UspC [Escherichia fergusonii]
MAYTNILVAVAVTPESQQLLAKAVSIARPLNSRVSLITLASDPEMYNQFAAPMLEDLREVMQEEIYDFFRQLEQEAGYPIAQSFIAYGEMSEHILAMCRKHKFDLVICGNHNHSFFSRASCSAKSVIGSSEVDVLLVPLSGS